MRSRFEKRDVEKVKRKKKKKKGNIKQIQVCGQFKFEIDRII